MCAAERPQSLSATRSRRPRTRYYYYGRLFLETWSISNTAQNCRRNSSADDSRVMQCTSSYGGASASSNTPKLFQDNAHRHARSHGMRYAIQRTRETEKKARDQCVVIISIITKPCASALCAFWPDVATQCDAGVRRVKPSRAQHSPPVASPRTSWRCVYFWSRRTRAKCAHCLQLQLLLHARIAHTRNA